MLPFWAPTPGFTSSERQACTSDNAYMSSLHHAAQQGFSTEARAYARGRPEYPPELLPG